MITTNVVNNDEAIAGIALNNENQDDTTAAVEAASLTRSKEDQNNLVNRAKFEEQMIKKLNDTNQAQSSNDTNQAQASATKNTLSFDMNESVLIQKRGMNRTQYNYLVDVILNKRNHVPNYYNYKRAYWVKQIGNSYQLHSCLSEKAKKKNPNGSKIV